MKHVIECLANELRVDRCLRNARNLEKVHGRDMIVAAVEILAHEEGDLPCCPARAGSGFSDRASMRRMVSDLK